MENQREIDTRSVTHLSVQPCRHCDDSSCFIVDGEHVGGWTFRVLRQDLVAQHPIRCFGVIFVDGRHRHNKRPCGRAKQRQDAKYFHFIYLFPFLFFWEIKRRGVNLRSELHQHSWI